MIVEESVKIYYIWHIFILEPFFGGAFLSLSLLTLLAAFKIVPFLPAPKPSRLVDWLNARNFLAPPCVKSGKLAVRGWTLLQSTWPCSIYEDILLSFNEIECCFIPVQWENRVTLTMKRIEAGRQFPMIKQLPWQLAVNRGAVGESRTSGRRGKTPWGKLVSAINTVRKSQAASRWGPWKFRPSTAYGAFQPHTRAQTRVPGQWVGYSCAVPGCHNSVGQMSPGRTQLLLLIITGAQKIGAFWHPDRFKFKLHLHVNKFSQSVLVWHSQL